jgi:hypothetical protein
MPSVVPDTARPEKYHVLDARFILRVSTIGGNAKIKEDGSTACGINSVSCCSCYLFRVAIPSILEDRAAQLINRPDRQAGESEGRGVSPFSATNHAFGLLAPLRFPSGKVGLKTTTLKPFLGTPGE